MIDEMFCVELEALEHMSNYPVVPRAMAPLQAMVLPRDKTPKFQKMNYNNIIYTQSL